MPYNRFYYPHELAKNQKITFKGEEFKHLKVMRLSSKDQCEVINGNNLIATARVDQILNKQAELTIISVIKKQPPLAKILCIALLTSKKLELIVEKATELGISEFWFFKAKNSKVKILKQAQIERLKKIIIAAVKQCGRLDLPKIKFFTSLVQIDRFKGIKFYGDTSENALRFDHISFSQKPKLIIIGPEMGFTKQEVDFLNSKEIIGIKLSQFILRAETAAIIASGIISQP